MQPVKASEIFRNLEISRFKISYKIILAADPSGYHYNNSKIKL